MVHSNYRTCDMMSMLHDGVGGFFLLLGGAVMQVSGWFDRETALHKTLLSYTIGNI